MEEQGLGVIELFGGGLFKAKVFRMQQHLRKTTSLKLTKWMNQCNIFKHPPSIYIICESRHLPKFWGKKQPPMTALTCQCGTTSLTACGTRNQWRINEEHGNLSLAFVNLWQMARNILLIFLGVKSNKIVQGDVHINLWTKTKSSMSVTYWSDETRTAQLLSH